MREIVSYAAREATNDHDLVCFNATDQSLGGTMMRSDQLMSVGAVGVPIGCRGRMAASRLLCVSELG